MVEQIKLDSIEIKSFRGIKNSNIDFKGKSLVLVGENGSGKSSIVNAFEYLFAGKVDSLSGKQAVNHNKSIVHMGDSKNDLCIQAKINNQTITRTFNKLDCPDELNNLIDDFKNASFLLNRKKLLEFIETTPAKRYGRITSLIGFDDLDEIETTLNRTQKRFKDKVKNKTEEIDKKTAKITSLLDCENTEIYDKLNDILSKHNLENITETTNLKRYLKEFPINDFEKTNELSHLIKLFDIDFELINTEFEELLQNYSKATLYELKSTSTLLSILNNSSEYISSENPKTCPVCRRNIEPAQVLNYINHKKQELNENENTLLNWKKEYKEFKSKLFRLNNDLKTIENALTDYNYDFSFNLDDLIDKLEKLSKFEITLSEIDSNCLIDLEGKFNDLKDKIEYEFDNLDDDNSSELAHIYEILINLDQRQDLERELEIIENQYNTSLTTYELFKDKKQKEVERIIDNIQQLVIKYYNFIHSDEDFNSPEINVPKSRGISLNLKFKEIIADPRAFSSEGHLDSLGLCIFLAFVKQFNEYNFIILDDIISTVDLNHKERIAMLLLSEFKDYQFIITTHSNLWFRQLKNYVRNYHLGHAYIFAEIRTLDSLTGPVLTRNMISEELIDKYIEMGDTFASGNAIRRYLENIFETVCRVNQIPIALKEHYMVDDYFKVIRKYILKSKLLKQAPEIKEYYEKVFHIIDSSRYMGNLLSHDDDANLDVTINEVIKFRDAVHIFKRSMMCWECNKEYLNFKDDYKFAICTNKKCMDKVNFKTNE